MLNAEQFEPTKIGRYSVIRVHFDFPNDPDPSKLFVVLNHVNSGRNPYCKCLKATSRTHIYEESPEMLASCVLYQAGEVPFLPKKTVIEPDNDFNIAHAHFERYAKKNEYRVEGKMPDDFHGKLITAIKNSCRLSPKKAAELLNSIPEIR